VIWDAKLMLLWEKEKKRKQRTSSLLPKGIKSIYSEEIIKANKKG